MFTQKEIDYFKELVYSDLDGNCLPVTSENVLEFPHDRFPSLPKEEVDFLKNLHNKLLEMEKGSK